SLRITHQIPMIYRYEAAQRAPRPDGDQTAMPLLPVPAEIADGSLNPVLTVYFDLVQNGRRGATHWVAMVDTTTVSILHVEEAVNHVDGTVFLADPVTTNGGPMPNANDAALNPLRVQVTLPNLLQSDPQTLTGTNVKLVDIDGPVRPPVVPVPGSGFE